MDVTSWGRGQDTDASRDDALYGLSGLRVLDKGCIFDALLDLIAFGHRAFPRGNGFVNVNGHAEVMSERRLVTRNFSLIPAAQAEFTCNAPIVASQGFCAIRLLPWSRRNVLPHPCSQAVRKARHSGSLSDD